MKKNNLLVIWAYMAWIAVALKFAKQNNEEKSCTEWECSLKNFSEKLVTIHKNLFNYIENNWMSPNSKKYLDEKVGEITRHVEEFKNESLKKIEELKSNWIEKKSEIEAEIKKIYEDKKILVEDLKNTLDSVKLEVNWVDYMKIWKENLEKAFNELKEKFNK